MMMQTRTHITRIPLASAVARPARALRVRASADNNTTTTTTEAPSSTVFYGGQVSHRTLTLHVSIIVQMRSSGVH